jgi:hypothetical protein
MRLLDTRADIVGRDRQGNLAAVIEVKDRQDLSAQLAPLLSEQIAQLRRSAPHQSFVAALQHVPHDERFEAALAFVRDSAFGI